MPLLLIGRLILPILKEVPPLLLIGVSMLLHGATLLPRVLLLLLIGSATP